MLKKDSNYQKLRLGGRSWLTQASYWIGPNHLLVVEVANYVERYRRFYFRDVQAVLVQKSATRLGWNIGLGVFALGTLAILLYVVMESAQDGLQNGDYFAIGAWLAVLLLFTTLMLVNTLRGPGCTVYLRTAVQNQRLSGVVRWRKAELLVAALTPLITAAQSSLASVGSPADAPVAVSAPVILDDPNVPPRIV